METKTPSTAQDFATLLQLSLGYCVPRCLHVIARLGIADLLNDTPQSAEQLASAAGAHPLALERTLKLLAAHGVFKAQDNLFQHSPISLLLKSDHPQSLRDFVRMIGLPVNWRIYEYLDYSVQTGRPAAEKVVPEGLWAYYSAHPEEASIFNSAMASKAKGQVAGVLAAYDFSGYHRIGDIGGGRGHLLQAVLEAVPTAEGVLFDLPNVVEEAAALASDRLRLQPGDFFKDPLPVCDVYLVMEIIHDWDDEEALAILKAIRKAAPDHARVLLIEQLITDDPGPQWPKTLDILMLTLMGGRQRSLQGYQDLLERAGFRLKQQIPTFADIYILEAFCQ